MLLNMPRWKSARKSRRSRKGKEGATGQEWLGRLESSINRERISSWSSGVLRWCGMPRSLRCSQAFSPLAWQAMVSRDPPPKGLRKTSREPSWYYWWDCPPPGVNLVGHPVYLQLFQQFVVVCNGGLQGLKEFLLSLQLLCHRTRPPASVSLALKRLFAKC